MSLGMEKIGGVCRQFDSVQSTGKQFAGVPKRFSSNRFFAFATNGAQRSFEQTIPPIEQCPPM